MFGRVDACARVVVIGGANTDVVGVSRAPLLARDSNPGHIRTSAGGVGRNVAENLARLGVPVTLITAFGGDDAGATLRGTCESVGIDTSLSLVVDELPSAHYLAILDENHDMSVAVNDMRVLESLTPAVLSEPEREAVIRQASIVVTDANLSAETLGWIVGHAGDAVVFEPVSVAKTGRATGLLAGLAALTPNAAEAAQLLGHEVRGIEGAEAAAREFVEKGVGAAFVTCGVLGTAWADATSSGTLPAPQVDVANASGAGDAFCAGVVWALLAGGGAHEAAAAGSVLAAAALQDKETVSRFVDAQATEAQVREMMRE